MGRSGASTAAWYRPDWAILRRRKEMPAHAAGAGVALPPDAVAAHVHRPSAALRVLVVDDDPVNLHVTSAMLACWGIRPLLAADGVQAVALAGEQPLDLILMDLQMPVLDGLGATQEIRRAEQALSRARVPVVAYTSISPKRALLGNFGIDDVLAKPCDETALRDCLLHWCVAKESAPAR